MSQTPGQRYLRDRHGISAEEARERLALEDEISKLAARLSEDDPQNFGGVFIEHEPVYRVIVKFRDPASRAEVRESLSPQLRRYVQVVNSRRSIAEREESIDRIISVIGPLGIQYASFYDHRTDKLVVEVAQPGEVAPVRQALATTDQNDVIVRVGSLPDEAQVSDNQPGDELYAGWWWYSSPTAASHSCSFAFPAVDNQNRDVILTAAHCSTTPHIFHDPNYSVLSAPTFEHYTYSTKYDYQGHVITGLVTGPYVWYEDNKIVLDGYENRDNQVTATGSSGYFTVTGMHGYYDQTVGQVICKSGRTTGFTCGKITHGWYTYRNAKGWIQVGDSNQDIIGFPGDSGAAVFTDSTYDYKVKAAGILSAVNTITVTNPDGTTKKRPCLPEDKTKGTVTDCYFIHMPIDYVDDHQFVRIKTGS